MNYFNFLYVFVLTCCFITGQAQNYFAQYNLTPLHTNPALTGAMQAKARILTSYSSEKFKAIRNPSYKANTLSVDGRFSLSETDYIGWGATGYRFNVGDLDYTNSKGRLSLAYGRLLHKDGDKSHFITLGSQVGFTSARVNLDDARFPSQHDGNGGFDPDTPALIDSINDQKTNFDLNVGLLWTSNLGHHTNFHIGLSAANLNKPNVSFLPDVNSTKPIHAIIHAGAELPISMHWSIIPQIIYHSINQYKQALPGLQVRKYGIGNEAQQFIQGGFSYLSDSLGSNNQINSDILTINASANIKGFIIGVAYGTTFMDNSEQLGVTNFELTVGYLIGQQASSPSYP